MLADTVIVLLAWPIPILAPAEIDTLDEVPFKTKFVAAGTVGPMIWMLLAPVESVILFPADSTMVPVDEANVPAEIAFRPEIVILEAPEANDKFGPSTKLTLLDVPLS